MEGGLAPARNVMVVADPTRESAGALQYALSHVVLEHDRLILIHVDNPNAWKNPFAFLKWPMPNSHFAPSSASAMSLEGGPGGEVDFLDAMKRACEIAQPKMNIRVEQVGMDGKERGPAILHYSELYSVDLLVIGQKRSLSNAILGQMKNGRPVDTADYLIENSKCTCVAVQKKGQNAGYLLNTKTQKNFWLLA